MRRLGVRGLGGREGGRERVRREGVRRLGVTGLGGRE